MKSNKLKVIVTIAILVIGALATVLVGAPSTSSSYQTDGTVIDFGNMETKWTGMNISNYDNAKSVLEYACSYNSYDLVFNSDGSIKKIKDVTSNEQYKWGLWVIENGSNTWKQIPAPYGDVKLSGYTVSSWSYCKEGGTPTVAVDQSGRCIYGYGQSNRTVSLSPSVTEMVATVGATKTLVGTDKYSNYPQEVVKMQNSGDIAIVGDYTTPSYEDIIRVNPDIILCDGSQYNHVQVAERLRSNNMNAFVLYNGESLDTILNNIFIVGQVLGYNLGASAKITDINNAANQMMSKLDSSSKAVKSNTMIALSPDMSPYVSGDHTYASDVLTRMYGINVFSDQLGWTHINSEMVMKYNPSVIVILTTEYKATQSEYDSMMSSLSSEWKSTDAYKNGKIYLICEGAGEMAQRPGPRVAQLMELFGRALNPDVFDDLTMPKFVGDNYRDYLTYTKYLE